MILKMARELVTGWLSSDSEDAGLLFEKTEFEGTKGHMRLQLQKTYEGDERFKLTGDFHVDKKAKLPEKMIGGMSRMERDQLLTEHKTKEKIAVVSTVV